MEYKNLIARLGFEPKENATDVFIKKYPGHGNYAIEVDVASNKIIYGKSIKSGTQTTLNFSQAENWVVLECVDRLLEKGYKPENITLEKVYPAGHGFSGRLDICVTREDGSEYLLIECKTYGKEYDKALTKLNKDGGQLFTYFKFSNKADIIMLYASELNAGKIIYKNEIVKIEEDYRTGDVKDFYDKWNKLTKDNGVFDSWVTSYQFVSRALTPKMLEPIKQEDSSFIFNRFLEILRHNVVSDKPNAFNKIFTLFLCKIYDEKVNEETDNQLGFQWLEGIDNDVSFQLRLTDLYKNGMYEFLEKKVTDFSETEFEQKFKSLDETTKSALLVEFKKLRLEKNNEFAIKEVYDEKSFKENAKVVKEVVELLQGFKIRYTKKQQYLSDFFELLLTTGLKQESGQFFTPVPIAQFIIKSLPIDSIVEEKLQKGEGNNLLPYVMDYAAGSGHFLTEAMHEIQRLIDNKDDKVYNPSTAKKIRNWKDDHFDWALDYIYGIEKDYRLVKVGKVGCYLHGDGLANVIHTDGLANFHHKDYKGKLKHSDKDFPQDNKQFDIVVSNPPYSVSAFKNAAREYYREKDFTLYDRLTDNSSEIECLFIERTKQLLKDGGVAGIILPSSILSNGGIYAKARETILQYFEIIAITELGSNTFMATGTNTVTLFLRRKNNYESINLKIAVDKFYTDFRDVTLNSVERPVAKYIEHVWENISFEDYCSLLNKTPTERIQEHYIFKDYKKKIKAKNAADLYAIIIEREKEKLFYFISAFLQNVVIIKSGDKDAEKQFLGYEFSNRRGSEGIHPMQRGENIEDCTALFDPEVFDNPAKASTYIYKAFNGDFDFDIAENLNNNVSRDRLIDMMTFDKSDFEKSISLTVKKKLKIESKWDIVTIGQIATTQYGYTDKATNTGRVRYLRITDLNHYGDISSDDDQKFINPSEEIENQFLLNDNDIVIARSGSVGKAGIYHSNKYPKMIFASYLIRVVADQNKVLPFYLFNFTKTNLYWDQVIANSIAVTQPNLNAEKIKDFLIPLPPKDVQEKIIEEISVCDLSEKSLIKKVKGFTNEISELMDSYFNSFDSIIKLGEIADFKRGPFGGALKKEIFVSDGYKIYEQKHAINNDFSLGRYYVNEEKFQEMKSFELLPGDIIMSCSGTIGKIAVFPESADKGIINQALLRFRVKKDFTTTEYLRICLSHITNKFIENSHGAGLKNVASVDTLKGISVYLPDFSKQHEIVNQIKGIETHIAKLKEEIDAIPKKREAILRKYI